MPGKPDLRSKLRNQPSLRATLISTNHICGAKRQTKWVGGWADVAEAYISSRLLQHHLPCKSGNGTRDPLLTMKSTILLLRVGTLLS